MTAHRRTLANGRSSTVATPKAKQMNAPPGPFTWQSRDMLESPAWRALTINGRRFLDRLQIDHLSHAGIENGNLKATYRQLAEYGLHQSEALEAIEVAIALGFVRRTGLRLPKVATTYRLTWYGRILDDGAVESSTNEWARLDQAGAAKAVKTARSKVAETRASQFNSHATTSRSRLPKTATTSRSRKKRLEQANPQKSANASATESRSPSISCKGTRERNNRNIAVNLARWCWAAVLLSSSNPRAEATEL